MAGTAGVVPQVAEPSMVADALVAVSEVHWGKKPFRFTADAVGDGGEEAPAVVDKMGVEFYDRFGVEKLLEVSL